MATTETRKERAMDRLQARYDANPILVLTVVARSDRSTWTVKVTRYAYFFDRTERASGAKRFQAKVLDANGEWHEREGRNSEEQILKVAHRLARWAVREC